MTDSKRELVPGSWSMARERTLICVSHGSGTEEKVSEKGKVFKEDLKERTEVA